MSAQVVGKLESEDLTRWQQIVARREAQKLSPTSYSATELEQHEMVFIRFNAEIAHRYGMDDSRMWQVSQFTGLIWYGEAE